ncbi:MAG: (deoxy)nucleoside triphosphate pyrophosphohydrolase [Desulfobulbaceae bacterium]|nr:(deoxy)nucleoside triphosphate pyrophosphohydrolase [Desulfobulbaceae bacterium]
MPDETRPHIHVACAIIERGGLVLVAQRSETMTLPLKWEFPGGKIRQDESPEGCIVREIHEEMGVKAIITSQLNPSTHSYSFFTVTLYPFICSLNNEEPRLLEHAALQWLPLDKLHTVDWAEADLPVLASYCRHRHETWD